MIKTKKWGKYDEKSVHLYELTNNNGVVTRITDYGARVVSLTLPWFEEKPLDVLLGFDGLDGYLKDDAFFGATVGRYANRIKGGNLELGGKKYSLTQNEGKNHLHGGEDGFDARLWRGEPVDTAEGPGVDFHYVSKDGEEGYPGRLNVSVRYVLTQENELKIDVEGTTDRTTVLSITNHNYYNLTGTREDIHSHQLTINADEFTPVDSDFIPTGEIVPVQGTPMDLRTRKTLEGVIKQDHPQINIGKGLNHNFVLNKQPEDEDWAAELFAPSTGVRMRLHTDLPCVQCYTAGYLDPNVKGKAGQQYGIHDAICLEPQHFPDAPNQSNFPTLLLKPGEKYESKIRLDFGRTDVAS